MIRRLVVIAAILIVALLAIASGAAYWIVGRDGVRVELERQASAWLGQPVAIGGARVHIFPRPAISLRNVRAGDPVRVTLDDVELSTGLKPLWSRRLEDAEVAVSNGRIEMPLPFTVPGPGAAGTTATTPVSSNALQIISVRSIRLQNITLVSRGREIAISTDSSVSGERVNLDHFTAVSGATSLDGSGTVQLAPRFDAQLRVIAKRIDVDDLVALGDAFAPRTTQAPATSGLVPGRIVARISADSARASGVDVRQFVTTAVVQGNRISLSPVSFQLFGGTYRGALDIDSRASMLQTTVRAEVADLDVAQLAVFGGVPDTITGRLSGTGTFNGRGATIGDAIAAAAGEGTVAIVNGTIARLGLVRTIVLFFGRPAPNAGASTDHFDRIDATFGLIQQVLAARALSLHSADLDLVGQGSLTVPTKALDGRADLSLSEALSAQAGTDFARFTREGNRIVLPAIVSGTLDAPQVTIDAGAAVRRGLRDEVQRRLKGILSGLAPPPLEQ